MNVRVSRYFALQKDFEPSPQAQIIGRFRGGAPAFIEHRFGQGRVLTFLSSCGPDWNNWPQNPSYVILQLELQKYLAEASEQEQGHVTGEPIVIAINPPIHTGEVEIQSPTAAGGDVLRLRGGEPRRNGGGDRILQRRQWGSSPSPILTCRILYHHLRFSIATIRLTCGDRLLTIPSLKKVHLR